MRSHQVARHTGIAVNMLIRPSWFRKASWFKQVTRTQEPRSILLLVMLPCTGSCSVHR